MDSIDLSDDDDDELPTSIQEPIVQLTVCSAPSTPTGERDPPVAFRRSSITAAAGNNELPQIEVKYQGINNETDVTSADGTGLIDTFFGCLKPFFSAVNKIGENMKYHRDTALTTSTLNKSSDDWEIPIDSIMNNLLLIGTGNEGNVYRGQLGGQFVACKRVKTQNETNIKHLRKLNHVNVVKFRGKSLTLLDLISMWIVCRSGVSISPPLFYIVMEYCPYGSLHDILKRRREAGSYTKVAQVLDWSRQISHGVNYLHSNKIIHRDLKSPNIVIAENFILKISDFGTSKQIVDRRSQPMSFNGTSAWMAPEVIRHEPCSEKIDVW
jgi:mitogen-activated protein kinase kinase kinase 13